MKMSRVMCAVVLLLFALPFLGQSQNPRQRPPAPQPPTGTRLTPPPAPAEAAAPEVTLGDVLLIRPGTDPGPAQGLVKAPESPEPGTAGPFGISDPLGVAYWELYDRSKPITLTGKVTRVEWSNPNSYIYMAATDGAWAVESSLVQLRQSHVSPPVRVGETITIAGFLPKDDPVCPIAPKLPRNATTYFRNSHLIRAGEITTVFGQKLTLGKPPTEAETEARLRYFSLGC